MPILHIEHQITDLDTWLETFRRFAPAREQAGVKSAHVWQPAEDPHSIVVNLEFESEAAAANFRNFLREQVWSSPETAPALAGSPTAVILNEVVV